MRFATFAETTTPTVIVAKAHFSIRGLLYRIEIQNGNRSVPMPPLTRLGLTFFFLALAAPWLTAQEPTGVLTSHPERRARAEEHYRLGVELMERDELEAARGHLDYAVALDPMHQDALARLAYLLYTKGTSPEARGLSHHYLSRMIDLDPRNVFALTYRSQVRTFLGWFSDAEADARAGLALDEGNQGLLLLLGNALLRQLRFEEAGEVYRRALEREPSDLLAQWCQKLATIRGADPPEKSSNLAYPPEDRARAPVHFTNVARTLGLDVLNRGRGNAWADFDGDGREDLFCAGIRDPHVLFRGLDEGRFRNVTGASGLGDPRGGWASLAADVDNDGDVDLYVTRDAWSGPGTNSLYLNDGKGRFVDRAVEAGVTADGDSFMAAFADYDKDGLLDVYVANGVSLRQGSPNVLYRNLGNGRFEDVSEAAGVANDGSSVGCAWGDYDGDGDPDLYVANYGGDNALYRNRGDGTFEDVTLASKTVGPRYSFVTFFFDYDNDARLDLFVASWTSDFRTALRSGVEGRVVDPERRLTLLHNDGDGTFRDVTERAGLARNTGTMGAAFFDLDNDGHLDILLGNGGPTMDRYEPDLIFHNRGDGTFLEISRSSGLDNLGKTHGITAHDLDGDGFLDLYASVGGQEIGDRQPNAFYRNEGSVDPQGSQAHHWLRIRLIGTRSSRDAVGTKVTVWTGDELRFQERAIGGGFGSTSSPPLHFGLGRHTGADRVEIVWPSGARQTLVDVPADRSLRVREGEEGYQLEGTP